MQQEYEMSCYYLDEADIAIQQSLYDLLEKVKSPTTVLSPGQDGPCTECFDHFAGGQQPFDKETTCPSIPAALEAQSLL